MKLLLCYHWATSFLLTTLHGPLDVDRLICVFLFFLGENKIVQMVSFGMELVAFFTSFALVLLLDGLKEYSSILSELLFITCSLQFGALPVFVVDGTPSTLKSRARITRFLQASGIDPSTFPIAEGGVSVERNRAFKKCVKECVVSSLFSVGHIKICCSCLSLDYVIMICLFLHSTQELLELLGIPLMHAKGEAEALCAQLNRGGYVEACITADSDAFLYGAKCVIKCVHPNSKVSVM